MTHFKHAIILALALGFAGCTTDAPTPEDESRDQSIDPTLELDTPDSAIEPGAAAANPTCAAGAVGDQKWFNSGCCTSKQRQQLYRCDGRHWNPLVNRYRCLASSCAI